MRDEEDGRRALELVDGLREALGGVGVEGAGGFIEDEDVFPRARQFGWGDDSEASRYLAFCILRDYAPQHAHALYDKFHGDFIKQIREDEWQITNEELDEGIRFWSDMMRIAPPIVAGEPMRRITIPTFLYRTFIKRVKLPGGSVKPEAVDEAVKKLADMRAREEVSSVVAEAPSDYAPALRPAE